MSAKKKIKKLKKKIAKLKVQHRIKLAELKAEYSLHHVVLEYCCACVQPPVKNTKSQCEDHTPTVITNKADKKRQQASRSILLKPFKNSPCKHCPALAGGLCRCACKKFGKP